jgi:phosphatidylethanolamine/phosphatidyl-N-methylethanolamine N-methyltransferase
MDSSTRLVPGTVHLGQFLWSWVQNPWAVGAIAPSGRELSRLMVQGIGPDSRVLELGAGTGTVTEAVLEAGVLESNLELVERDPRFVRVLERYFPRVSVHSIDALSLARHLRHRAGQIDCVISGLPLLLFSRRKRMRILAGAFALLAEGGSFHQFTYAARCPVESRVLERLGLSATRLGIVARNFPPAFVYQIRRDSQPETP